MADADTLKRLRAQISAIESGKEQAADMPGAHAAPRRHDAKEAPLPAEAAPASAPVQKRRGKAPVDPADENGALSKIIELVNYQERSRAQIRERLERAGYAPKTIASALARAERAGIVSDARFADILIRSRINQGRGSRGIEQELAKNDIDPETVAGWPFDYDVDEEAEYARAIELLERKPPHAKNLRESAYRRLMGKGYPSSVASRVARDWANEHDGGARR